MAHSNALIAFVIAISALSIVTCSSSGSERSIAFAASTAFFKTFIEASVYVCCISLSFIYFSPDFIALSRPS